MLPFPVNYQALSGEGTKMSPAPLIKQGNADLMNNLGVPVELFQGTMDLQAAPTALRLFQATWPQLVSNLDGWLQWFTDKIAETFGWEPVNVHLQPVTYADDLDRKDMLLQLAASQQISKQTAFSSIGIDPMEEQRRMLEESRIQMETQQEFEQDEMKKQELQQLSELPPSQPNAMEGMVGGDPAMAGQQGVVQPMGGMPGMTMPGAGGGPTTPGAVMAQADELSQQLMSMPETMRRSQLIQLKQSNPMLHAVVRQKMDSMSQQAATMGVSQMRQEMQGAPSMM